MIQKRTIFFVMLIVLKAATAYAQQGQLPIRRLAGIASAPTPYQMRDWRMVTEQYDSLIYNTEITGQFFPLIYLQAGGTNYPLQEKFGLHTYIGTKSPMGNEAINVLPSLVGATLVGIDKTNQFGKNWVKMSYDFFNKSNGEGLYLNSSSAQSGNDWWYDVMPNVYFYQLFDLYKGLDDEAKNQFYSIADKFTAAIKKMGGDDSPWKVPYMNYRAWKFKTMEPLNTGVTEPEAAGAMAWVLFNAWKESGNPEYLKACEWAMEFLDNWQTNPSYELQLPYGVYTAARMNAELQTGYNIDKMVNWCFDRGPLRGWGCVRGKWGGLDVTGLIGEANDNGNDYAFQMNGLQHAAALLPMTRYDKRYTRDIARWVLHLANATRLFYHGFLPSGQQDASNWSAQYDEKKVLGYEALREVWQNKSPFSTGDALKGGWAATNLSLYSTSSIGYMGALIKKTDVDKILELDLLKTDFFREEAYPTFVYYNPTNSPAEITIALGSEPKDLYETLNEKFILQNASGAVKIIIPANEAIMIVHCPAGGNISYQDNKMLVNDVVVDFAQTKVSYSARPRIQALSGDSTAVQIGKSISLYCKAMDNDSPQLIYQWLTSDGFITGTGTNVQFTAPQEEGKISVKCIVSDETGLVDSASLEINIVQKINTKPEVPAIRKDKSYIQPMESIQLWCDATDEDGDNLLFNWSSSGGQLSVSDSTAFFTATAEGIYTINVAVTDGFHPSDIVTTKILVKKFSNEKYNALAYYDFAGNATDKSGNNFNGIPKGVILTADRKQKPLEAYYFNGGNQHILVPNDSRLNFTQAISVCTWFKPVSQPDKETFLVSHGSWQERWKLSITQDRKLRWTINTANGIADLDGETRLFNDTYYQSCVSYDGRDMMLYLNGKLETFKTHSGSLRTTAKGMTIGQMNPEIADYNFKGVIDEVAIYNQMVQAWQVDEIYSEGIINGLYSLTDDFINIYPNPATDVISLKYENRHISPTSAELLDCNGKLITKIEIIDELQSIQLKGMAKGKYTLRIYHTGGSVSIPFIKM